MFDNHYYILIKSMIKKNFIPYTLDRWMGLLGSSAGKESICNTGDLGSIPGLERSSGKEIAYPLQYSWASLMAQMVKKLPAMWET